MVRQKESKQKRACATDLDAYGTHLPVLERVFEAVKVRSVLEFGCGNYSTAFFVSRCERVTAIEQQSHAVFEIMGRKYAENDQLTLLYLPGVGRGPEYLREYQGSFDLVFVDGDAESRTHCVNEAFEKTGLIVAHDTEDKRYSWDRVQKPDGWVAIEYTDLTPCTTVWVTDEETAEKLSK